MIVQLAMAVIALAVSIFNMDLVWNDRWANVTFFVEIILDFVLATPTYRFHSCCSFINIVIEHIDHVFLLLLW